MARMHHSPHPGEVLREYLGDITVTDAADHLRGTRAALSRILNGSTGICADMALRPRDALGTSADMWLGMHTRHELWNAGKKSGSGSRPCRSTRPLDRQDRMTDAA